MSDNALALHDELIRSMNPLQKLLVSEELRRSAWLLKSAFLRSTHRDESEEQIQERVRQLFLDVRT
jgi:hypothetical protein